MSRQLSRALVVCIVLALMILNSTVPAHALIFEEQKLPDGHWILLARDCGKRQSDNCSKEELNGFHGPGRYPRPNSAAEYYEGDAARLRTLLKNRNYDEV